MTNHPNPGGQPVADPASIRAGDRYRITVLTEALVRIEWSEDGVFEDRASTFAVNRALPVPKFEVIEGDRRLEIVTERLHLDYDCEPFAPSGLSVTVRGDLEHPHGRTWRFGEPAPDLGGTARTLDEADGAVPLGGGVVSRLGCAVVDDSGSFLLEADGRPALRRPGTVDLYVFAHGHDYRAAVRDLYALSGPTPVLPRWALGNWWSKYHPYSAADYLALLDRFAVQDLPFSVAVLDMDWHLVDIDPRYGSGWTGYTWNTELFPDPPAFLAELHERGLHVTLNVHPADGIRAHEQVYPPVAQAMGIDPASELPVAFDLTDPTFVRAYFELVHHPLEHQGVDFWWLDWQQGSHSRLASVDPLWLLNMGHFLDHNRGGRRGVIFSRYAGPGSHRYPIGFSGDSVISWASLAFQPYFTATASNVGFGWWSHDVGGHLFGSRDDVLACRWAQFGVFSPIMRLHSTRHRFINKEPWTYGPEAGRRIGEALRLRHRLVPYLHTMNARAAHDGAPLVEPMYWADPEAPPAYRVPNQYRFGTELVVAPITAPQQPDLALGSVRAWLPDGVWTDVFTGVTYRGGRELRLHRTLDSIPVLLRAGGIVPLAGEPGGPSVPADVNPECLELLLAPGADGRFELLEEQGIGDGRDPLTWARTPISYDEGECRLTIGPVTGPTAGLPGVRTWTVTVVGAAEGTAAVVEGSDAALAVNVSHRGVSFELAPTAISEPISLRLTELRARGWDHVVRDVFDLLDRAQLRYQDKEDAYGVISASSGPLEAAARVQGLELSPDLTSALLELVLADYQLAVG